MFWLRCDLAFWLVICVLVWVGAVCHGVLVVFGVCCLLIISVLGLRLSGVWLVWVTCCVSCLFAAGFSVYVYFVGCVGKLVCVWMVDCWCCWVLVVLFGCLLFCVCFGVLLVWCFVNLFVVVVSVGICWFTLFTRLFSWLVVALIVLLFSLNAFCEFCSLVSYFVVIVGLLAC